MGFKNHKTSRSEEIVDLFFEVLEQKFAKSKPLLNPSSLKIKHFADAQKLHPNYLSGIIKRQTGETVGFWIKKKMMDTAKLALLDESLSIKEISFNLGFADPAHFSNYFKKYTSQSPVIYRRTKINIQNK